MGVINNCLGADRQKGTPEIQIKHCPCCGAENEIFSNESSVFCTACGARIEQERKRSAVFKDNSSK